MAITKKAVAQSSYRAPLTARILLDRLARHRRNTFNLRPARPLASQAQARRFVNQRGFVFLWPIKGVELPSLWTAVAGDRPVADAHDDPGHITWGWKDDALSKRIWYYAKVLRRKATVISLEVAPYFYALTHNFGSLTEDHILAYEDGKLTLAAKNIYDALLTGGPLDSIALRKAARMIGAKESEWNRALEDLQMDFKILPVGVAEAGSWRYAFIYDITARHFASLAEQARGISEAQARSRLIQLYFDSVGVARRRDVLHLFGWPSDLADRTIHHLEQDGSLRRTLHPNQDGEWLALPALCR
ncbi:MAG TPA: crosslink repair DNA glycosylase YcaQ family protein [Anaerolineales bacterium]|nr:crosslink repair DNA glycosylase YcaQ family protein [Anaerolineales bacterium]